MSNVPPTTPVLPLLPVNSTTAKSSSAPSSQPIAPTPKAPMGMTGSSGFVAVLSVAAQAMGAFREIFSTAKVNQLKAAIEEGCFEVDSEKIAEHLIRDVHDFLETQRR